MIRLGGLGGLALRYQPPLQPSPSEWQTADSGIHLHASIPTSNCNRLE
jgi:hypothetical protein